jgi:Hypothetical glycosyl hydrolase family 15
VLPAIALFAIAALPTGPAHVATADYWGGYSGTHLVSAQVAAGWLTWASVNIDGSKTLRPLGVKTMLYTDPNRQIAGEPLYSSDESTFAHDCAGARIPTQRAGQYLMDPRSESVWRVWKSLVDRYNAEGHFDAIFEDDADDLYGVRVMPCNFDAAAWQAATIAMQRSLGMPVIYNGLSIQTGADISSVIALNATAIGGMMEECYAARQHSEVGGAQWLATEATEGKMAAERKLFFCLALDSAEANVSLQGRMYVFASFLLGYSPASPILWEIYRTPSRQHIMPEVQLVPNDGRSVPPDIAAMLTPSGAYLRSFASCRLAGRDGGPCIVVVNPDAIPHRVNRAGFTRQLVLQGGGVLDGGVASIAAGGSDDLPALSAEILFR